jgi:hypothetical protein
MVETQTADEVGIDVPDDWETPVIEADGVDFGDETVTDGTAVYLELPEKRTTKLGESAGTDVTIEARHFMVVRATIELTDDERMQMEMMGEDASDIPETVTNTNILHTNEDGEMGSDVFNEEDISIQSAINEYFSLDSEESLETEDESEDEEAATIGGE